MVHLAFFVGKLTCAVARCLVHYIRWLYLKIAGIRCAVKEELDECALKFGSFADIHRKSGAGNLHTKVEVYQIVFLGQVPVGQGVLAELGHRAACLLDNIVGCGLAFGNHGAWHVGNRQKYLADAVFGGREFIGYGFLLLFYRADCGFKFFGFFFGSGFHQLAYLGGMFLEYGGKIVVFELEGTAAVIVLNNFADGFRTVETLHRKAFHYLLRIFFDLL